MCSRTFLISCQADKENNTYEELTIVVNWLSVSEEFNGWVTSDFIFSGTCLMDCGINLSKFNFRVILCQGFGSFLIFRGKSFAVSAPWGIWNIQTNLR